MTVRTLTVFINEALLNRPLWPADTQTRSFQKSSWENIVKLIILMGNFRRWLFVSSDIFYTKINLRQEKRQYENCIWNAFNQRTVESETEYTEKIA